MTTRRWALPAGMAAAFLWHLALRVHGFGLPLLFDEGVYAYVARVWSAGGLPYRDAFDQKPPMIYAIYRLCAALSSSPYAPRAAAVLAVLLTALALLLLTPKRWSPAARLAAPAAYFALSTLPVGDFGFAANTEVFAAAFTAWAAWAGGRSAALSGLLAGAALMTKQTALWPVLAVGAAAAWTAPRSRWNPRAAAAFAAGAAAVPLLWIGYFAARGGLADFWECAVAGNMRYASTAGWSDAAEQGRFLAFDLGPQFLKACWPAWALAILGLSGVEVRRENRGELAAGLWLAGGLLAASTGLLFFPHYFLQAAPPLCLAAAYGAARLGKGRAWAALAALALAPAAAHARLYFAEGREAVAKDLLYPSPLLEAEWLGAWLRERTAPSDSIWVFGAEPALYVYSGRRAATRHDYVYPLTMFPKGPEPLARELAALREAKPAYVVYVNQRASLLIGSRLGLAFRDAVREWLAADYRLEGYVPVPRDPAPIALVPAAAADWSAGDRLYVFRRR